MRWIDNFITIAGNPVIEGIGSEESGAEIHCLEDGTFDLYEITQYGTAILYDSNHSTIQSAKNATKLWT